MDSDTRNKLLSAAFRFISIRPRSEKEIRDYIAKRLNVWKIKDTDLSTEVLNRLGDLGYADDRKFIEWWTGARMRTKPKGFRLIEQELIAKGVNRDAIREFLDTNRKDQDKSSLFSELDAARKAVHPKLRLWQKLSGFERKNKIMGYLYRRGFASETIRRVIDEIFQKVYNSTQ